MRAVLGDVPSPPPLSARLAALPRPRFYPELVKAATRGEVTSEDVRYLRALYDAEVYVIDREVGRLLHGLRAAGREDSTLVVLTADHGEAFLEHGKMQHTSSLYQEMLHVPLVVALPGRQEGRRVPHWIQQIDIAPTILDAIGLPVPPSMLGESRLPGRDPGEGPVFAEASADRRFKIIRDGFSYVGRPGAPAQGELYNLGKDPGEKSNIRAARPGLAGRLARELDEYLRVHRERGQNLRRGTAGALDAERQEELRALGYAQ
jgi:arylsulfatase A-like enzyme